MIVDQVRVAVALGRAQLAKRRAPDTFAYALGDDIEWLVRHIDRLQAELTEERAKWQS